MIKHTRNEFRECSTKGIEYTENDLIQLLKLKNIDMSNMLRIDCNIHSFLNRLDDYAFTISIIYKRENCNNSTIHFVDICEGDLIRYNRNNSLHKINNI